MLTRIIIVKPFSQNYLREIGLASSFHILASYILCAYLHGGPNCDAGIVLLPRKIQFYIGSDRFIVFLFYWVLGLIARRCIGLFISVNGVLGIILANIGSIHFCESCFPWITSVLLLAFISIYLTFFCRTFHDKETLGRGWGTKSFLIPAKKENMQCF